MPDDWPQFFVPRKQEQFSLDYPYLYQARLTCRTPVDIMVVIPTLPENHLKRQAIRNTWGSVVRTHTWPGPPPEDPLAMTLGLIFLMGEKKSGLDVSEVVRRESDKYGDVVQWKGMHDTYFNLTMKVLLGLSWVAEFCPLVSHVIKTDDDTFVHLPRLLHRLMAEMSETRIWGPYFVNAYCERTGKYAVSKESYPFDRYPPHVKGNLYVLPGKAVPRMVATAPFLPYNNMEDVHVTGTLARALGLRHTPLSGIEFSTSPTSPEPCLFERNKKAVGAQSVNPQLMLRIWGNFSDPTLCAEV
ncbi:hypothetical protein ACOMHN_017893 [Nucella lapillus]